MPELLLLSVADQVTVCVPTVNGPELSGVADEAPSTRSFAVEAPRLTGVDGPVASTVISAGAVTVGPAVSVTTIVCVSVDLLPEVCEIINYLLIVEIHNKSKI